MKKLLYIIVLVLGFSNICKAQNGLLANNFTSVATGGAINLLNTGISFHMLTWNVTGTVSTCVVDLDSSIDGINWTVAEAITFQTCTSNGVSPVTNVTANYVRINMGAFVGTGSVSVTWTGWVTNPGGGSGLPAGSSPIYYAAGGGTAQAQTVAPTSPITNASLIPSTSICWLPVAANSGPGPTLAGSGTSTFSAKTITKYGTVPLIANDINPSTKNPLACAVYDGTEFQLQNPLAGNIVQTSYQAVGASAQAINLYVSGGCDGVSSCTGNFFGLLAPPSMPASLQYLVPTTDGSAGASLQTDGAQHMRWFGPVASSTPVTSSNPTINTDQNLIQLTLPAGYFNTLTQPFYIEAGGIYSSTAASTPALTIKAKLCTVSGCGSGTVVPLFSIVTTALNTTALTNATFNLSGICVTSTIGATGNLMCHGKPGLTLDTGATLSAPDTVFADTNTAVSSPNIDLTAALFLQFTIAQSVAGASNSYTQQLAAIR